MGSYTTNLWICGNSANKPRPESFRHVISQPEPSEGRLVILKRFQCGASDVAEKLICFGVGGLVRH